MMSWIYYIRFVRPISRNIYPVPIAVADIIIMDIFRVAYGDIYVQFFLTIRSS